MDDDLIEAMARAIAMVSDPQEDDYDCEARAALAAIRAAGYAVVPVEPTDEMKRAGACAVIDDEYGMWIGNNWEMSEAAYRAMIAAAQEAKP